MAVTTTRPSWAETGACALVLGLVGAAVFGPHVTGAGFLQDDWDLQSQSRFAPQPGLLGAYEQAASMRFFDYRPGVSLVFATTHELFGTAVSAHLALAAAIGVLVSVLFHRLLRELGIGALPAAAMALLSLLYPFSDTTRLWAAGGVNNLGVVLYLLATLVALHGLRAGGARAAVLLHAGALVLYVLSVLTYQVAAPLALLSGLVYALRAPWRSVLARWALDFVAVAAATAIVVVNAPRRIQTLDSQLDHALDIARESVSLLAWTAVPLGPPRPVAVGLVALVVILASLVASRRRPARDPVRDELRRWLAVAAAGVLVIAAGYSIIAPANPFFVPLTPGTANRINGVPGLGFTIVVYALAMLADVLALGARRRAALPAIVLSVVLAVGYVVRLRESEAAWADSWRIQGEVLAAIDRGLPAGSRSGATVYSFGHPIDAAPGIAVFRQLDLRPAVKVALGDASVTGWPVLPRTAFACERDRIYPTNNRYGPPNGAAYGRAFFVDVSGGRAARIDSRGECRRATRSFRPGPLLAPLR